MGCCCSKNDDIDYDAIKNAGAVYETDRIFYDEHGNLRFGRKPRNRKEEFAIFCKPDVDDTEEHPNKEWYIVDTAWIQCWLSFVHLSDADHTYPDPGACLTHRLLVHDEDYEGWKPRPGLKMATTSDVGDYRRVSKAAWLLFCQKFKGSGPAIKMYFNPQGTAEKEALKTGDMTTYYWEIDQSSYIPPPNREELKKMRVKEALEEDLSLNVDDERPHDSDDEADIPEKDSDDEEETKVGLVGARKADESDSDDDGTDSDDDEDEAGEVDDEV